MKIKFSLLGLAVLAFSCQSKQEMEEKMTYPITKKGETVDVYFGTEIADPYRWLEDDRSEETAQWVKEQNELTFGYLEKIPYRNALKTRMEQLWNYERISSPFSEGDNTYYYKNDGLQNQSVLYLKGKEGKDEVFIDPNTFSKDGTTSLAGLAFSDNGKLLAYSISEGGSDWRKVMVMNVETREILEDTLVDVKFSGISWKGNEGFYYSSYDKPKGSELSAKTDQHKLYYHRLGTPQKTDKVVFGIDQKRRYVSGNVTEDGNYLVISAAEATSGNELYIMDLREKNPRLQTVVGHFENDTYVLDNVGTTFYLVTNANAPNKKVVTMDIKNPTMEHWVDFIPETENVLNVSTSSGFIYANYMKDAVSYVEQFDYQGKKIRAIELPGVGSASGFSGKRKDEKVYYAFTNYITPTTIFEMDPKSGTSVVYQKPKVDFNPEDFVSEQVFYTSKDGTRVPMIITYKKGLNKNQKNPTMLYGYGGFNISLTPSFSPANMVWLEQGGIYAVANIRGGGEYGKKWHTAGTQMNKQNVFDDFIAAAEYLIKEQYTSSDYLAIRGGSNGGLLVGACMTQRPDLFRVAIPAVGVLDMLRYHTFTAGAGWAYDYGTSEQSEEMFKYLLGYSPVHNVKPGVKYPATMITTADHDDRVVPAHSFKFAAVLQEHQAGSLPVLIRIDVNAGHGAGKPISKTIEELSDVQAFALYNMGIKVLP